MSSARDIGALPDNDWYTRHASLTSLVDGQEASAIDAGRA